MRRTRESREIVDVPGGEDALSLEAEARLAGTPEGAAVLGSREARAAAADVAGYYRGITDRLIKEVIPGLTGTIAALAEQNRLTHETALQLMETMRGQQSIARDVIDFVKENPAIVLAVLSAGAGLLPSSVRTSVQGILGAGAEQAQDREESEDDGR